MKNEEQFLHSLKKRRHGSLEKIIDMYTPYVSVVVYNVIGAVMTKEDIEEVVSDAFLSLWRNASALDAEKGCIRSYLAATARNLAKNKLRRAAMHEEINDNIVSEYSEGDIERHEERMVLIDLIASLGEPDSEIFLRYYFYGEKISRIAAVTGLCSSTVKSRLSRGRRKLRVMLEEKEAWQ